MRRVTGGGGNSAVAGDTARMSVCGVRHAAPPSSSPIAASVRSRMRIKSDRLTACDDENPKVVKASKIAASTAPKPPGMGVVKAK